MVVSCIPVSCLNSVPLFRSFDFMGLIIFLQVHSRMKPKEPKIVFLSAPSQWNNPRQSTTTSPSSRILLPLTPFLFPWCFFGSWCHTTYLKKDLTAMGWIQALRRRGPGHKSPIRTESHLFCTHRDILGQYVLLALYLYFSLRCPVWGGLSDIGFW